MSTHPIFQGVFCSFGMHEWEVHYNEPNKNKKRVEDVSIYRHLKCKHCPVTRIEEK